MSTKEEDQINDYLAKINELLLDVSMYAYIEELAKSGDPRLLLAREAKEACYGWVRLVYFYDDLV